MVGIINVGIEAVPFGISPVRSTEPEYDNTTLPPTSAPVTVTSALAALGSRVSWAASRAAQVSRFMARNRGRGSGSGLSESVRFFTGSCTDDYVNGAFDVNREPIMNHQG